MKPALKQKIEKRLGRKIIRARRLSGGKVSPVVRLDLDSGGPIVAKLGSGAHDLTIEAYMLNYLRQRSCLPVPEVFHAEENLLLMAYIDGATGLDAGSQAHLGELLAECHQIAGDSYGLERDTLIGPFAQPNRPSESWIAFFREQRLLYMIDIAGQSGHLPRGLETRLKRFAEKVDGYLIEPPAPSLIHGDIWRENVLARGGRVVGILDPALYYAHHEMELAYMVLFDTADDDFFASYRQVWPLDADFMKTRFPIYSLYPLLVHLAYFGGAYIQRLDSVLRSFDF